MLLAVVGLAQLEEVVQAQELADALPHAAAGHQAAGRVVHEQQLVHVVRGRQAVRARTHAGGRVTAGIVLHGPRDVGAQLGQVRSQLEDAVHRTHKHLPSHPVHRQVGERSVRHHEGREGPAATHGPRHGRQEQQEEANSRHGRQLHPGTGLSREKQGQIRGLPPAPAPPPRPRALIHPQTGVPDGDRGPVRRASTRAHE